MDDMDHDSGAMREQILTSMQGRFGDYDVLSWTSRGRASSRRGVYRADR
jgi:hypothetical protein